MPEQYGQAGKSTRKMAADRRRNGLWIAIIGIGAILVVYALLTNATALGFGGFGFLALLVLLKVIPGVVENALRRNHRAEKRAVRGARGEEQIGEILSGLGEEYAVLHDVVSPYGNIDHIVLSKEHGIFLIETKAHSGTVDATGDNLLVNGKPPEKDFIKQTLSNTYWLREKVKEVTGGTAWITPILVFTNAFVKSSRPIKGIRVVNKKYLLAAIQRCSNRGNMSADIWSRREAIETVLEK
jgi:hypothetical protein